MSMLPAAWLVHTVTRAPKGAAPGTKGDPAFGGQVTFRARVQKTQRLVRTPEGREVLASHMLVTNTTIGIEDRFWFPSIAGEPADDVTRDDNARVPVALFTATDKAGSRCLFRAFFP